MGTAAHSWVMSFACEMEAFRKLQRVLGESTVQLIDTYDTIEGARHAAKLGQPLWGVRSTAATFSRFRARCAASWTRPGCADAKIMVSGDLDEYRIRDLVAAGAPIDSFGVGTQLATSGDAPSMSAIYKLVELDISGIKRFTAKYSDDKPSYPGAKQVFRAPHRDVIARSGECGQGEALLRPVILGGKLVEPLPSLDEARSARRESVAQALALSATIGSGRAVAGDPQPRTARVDRAHPPQPAGMKTVFFDIDSQLDFLYPAGALYVPGAERVVPGHRGAEPLRCTHTVSRSVSTADAHSEDDPEFAAWPHHCVAGTWASGKPRPPCWTGRVVVPNRECDLRHRRRAADHRREADGGRFRDGQPAPHSRPAGRPAARWFTEW